MASGSQNNTSFQAQKWTNLRAFTIGNTAKDVDGTAAVSWSKNEILGASDSTKFYRGDKTWSNTLTNMLILDNGSINGELLRLVGVNDKTFSFKLTSPSGQTDATNVDIGWDWAAGDGAGAAFRSALFPNQPGYFVIYARTNTTDEYTLVGKTDGTLTWTGKIIPNTGNTTGTVGGGEQPIYSNGGVLTNTSYALKATVNNGDAGYVAYYSGERVISSSKAVTGMIMPAHYYHNLYNNNPTTGTTVYVHYYNNDTTSTNTFANLRVKSGTSYKVLAFGGDGALSWNGTMTADGGYLKSTANSNTVTIGSQNADYTHIYNSANIPFIFNNTVESTSGDLGTTSYPWHNIYMGTANGTGIYYTGSKATYSMIRFIDNASSGDGNGISIGGGGQTIIGGGESASTAAAQVGTAGSEVMYVCNDGNVDIISNLQSGWDHRKIMTFNTSGYLMLPSYINVPTNNNENPTVSQFIVTNGSDHYYRKASTAHVMAAIRGVASGSWGISITGNAATATTLQTTHSIWGQDFNGSANITGQLSITNADIIISNSGTATRQIRWQTGDNDYARVGAGATAANAGWMEIATADDGNEPVYVRQYTGTFTTVKRTLILLDANGNTTLPGILYCSHINGTTYINRERHTDASSTEVGNTPMGLLGFKNGYPLYTDPEFASGTNSVSVYNNSGGSRVAISRISMTSGNSSGYALQITNNGRGNSSPGLGGFYQDISSRSNAVFVQIFRAKIPSDYTLNTASNSMGANYTDQWLTDPKGTGKWEWYARIVHCGNSGTFSGGGHVYITGDSGQTSVTWYLSYCNCFDITKGTYDGLRVRYADSADSATKATQDGSGNTITNKYFQIYNTTYQGDSSSVTVNDLAKQGPAYGMIYAATDNPTGGASWVHVLNMSWDKVNTSWIGQIALHTNGNTMYFRGNGSSAISGKGWNTVLSSNNYTSYTVTKTGSGASGSWGISVTGSSASCTGNAATATRIKGNLAAATSDVNRNIWVSSTASADGIPNYISGFNINPSTKVFTVPAGTRISPSAGDLYLGNSGNQKWVYIQDMCGQDGQKWKIHQNGNAEFTGTVTATKFSGPLTGNVTGNCSGSSGSCTGNAATATKATNDGDGNKISTTYAKIAAHNNLTAAGNEFTFASSGFSGAIWFNYRTAGGTNGNITQYTFGNGKGGSLASITAGTFNGNCSGSSGSCTGNAANVTGTVALAHGGTGGTSANDAIKNLALGVTEASGDFTDSTVMITNSNDGTTSNWYRRSAVKMYNYIKTKASGSWGISVTGSSGSCTGNAATATKLGTANKGSSNHPIYLSGGTPTECAYPKSGAWWTAVPFIHTDGMMEIGRYIDFHGTSNMTGDHTIRLTCATNTARIDCNGVFTATGWSDLAEYRRTIEHEPGRAVIPTDCGIARRATGRLQPGARIVSDTYGFCLGESDDEQSPIALTGRVLAYPCRPISEYHAGDAVCSGPNGTVDLMTREEIQQYPDCIVGIVNEIPTYPIWNPKHTDDRQRLVFNENVEVRGRIWIDVK